MPYVKVKIKYRDDKEKTIDCCDTPAVGSDWITIYPIGKPMKRLLIPKEAIAEIVWDYENDK